MMVVDDRLLHNNTIARIGEEHGIIKKPGEGFIEYVMRIIQELQDKPRDNWNFNQDPCAFFIIESKN